MTPLDRVPTRGPVFFLLGHPSIRTLEPVKLGPDDETNPMIDFGQTHLASSSKLNF